MAAVGKLDPRCAEDPPPLPPIRTAPPRAVQLARTWQPASWAHQKSCLAQLGGGGPRRWPQREQLALDGARLPQGEPRLRTHHSGVGLHARPCLPASKGTSTGGLRSQCAPPVEARSVTRCLGGICSGQRTSWRSSSASRSSTMGSRLKGACRRPPFRPVFFERGRLARRHKRGGAPRRCLSCRAHRAALTTATAPR